MRTSIISAAVLSAIFAGGMALADQTTGSIKAVDLANKSVTLETGTVYSFADSAKVHDVLGGYQVGDRVTIEWNMSGDVHEAQAMAPDFTAGVTGKISAFDEVAKTVTLEGGKTYTFSNEQDQRFLLGGYKVGDTVTIVAGTEGDAMIGHSIASHVSAEVTGKIKAIDLVEKLITLEDGAVYSFQNDKGEAVALDGYKVGDMVKVVATTVDASHQGEAISPANG